MLSCSCLLAWRVVVEKQGGEGLIVPDVACKICLSFLTAPAVHIGILTNWQHFFTFSVYFSSCLSTINCAVTYMTKFDSKDLQKFRSR